MASIELTWYTMTFLVVLLIASFNWTATAIGNDYFSIPIPGYWPPKLVNPNVQPVKTDLFGLIGSERFPLVTKIAQAVVYFLVTVAAIGLIVVMAEAAHADNNKKTEN